MTKLTTVEKERIDRFAQELIELHIRNDERTLSNPGDFRMRQLETPSQAMIDTARSVLSSLAKKDHSAPELECFIDDYSARDVQKVIAELRAIHERQERNEPRGAAQLAVSADCVPSSATLASREFKN